MLRKIAFLSLVGVLTIGITAFTYSSSQSTPKAEKKKSAAKDKPKPKKTSDHITWYSMTEGYEKAVKEKKVLVIDVYTDWCGWCKVMDKHTYENKNIVKKMNEYAVAVKFNPEVNGTHIVNGQTLTSDQLGSYLNRGSRIPGYPHTFLWKDLKSTNSIESYSGYLDSTAFNAFLNRIIQK